jgi:hypothetical protein
MFCRRFVRSLDKVLLHFHCLFVSYVHVYGLPKNNAGPLIEPSDHITAYQTRAPGAVRGLRLPSRAWSAPRDSDEALQKIHSLNDDGTGLFGRISNSLLPIVVSLSD